MSIQEKMKKKRKIMLIALTAALVLFLTPMTAFAVTEGEVEAQVTVHGREAVSGNLFVWFLCAVAFLKISQKIDSFMSSLGINVGNTGGSMMAELLIAGRGISAGKGFLSGSGFAGFGGRGGRAASGAGGTDGGSGGFLSGGLAGAIGRSFNRGAVKSATGGEGGGIGGRMFASSVAKGGGFANNVIGSVARGSVSATGTMTGAGAVSALNSYMGYTADAGLADAPAFSNVEIGGGRIMGTETTADSPDGIDFGMYHTDQYMAPGGKYDTVEAADGSKWYRQYAQDAVEKTPYMAPDGSIAYNESIVQKLPGMPRRKDRV